MTQSAPVISVQDLCCYSAQRKLLGPINLNIRPGRTAILGPNGSGKSTLLQALAGVLPDGLRRRGEIRIREKPLEKMSLAQRAKTIAWLAQDTQNSPGGGNFQTSLLTVQGLIQLAAIARFGWIASTHQDCAALIERNLKAFDLLDLRHQALQNISGGELQRAQLARVFAVESQILLLDEPSNHLDLQHQLRLEKAMAQSQGGGDSALEVCAFSTHDLNLALQADFLVLMKHGRICQEVHLATAQDDEVEASFLNCFETPVKVIHFQQGRRAIRV